MTIGCPDGGRDVGICWITSEGARAVLPSHTRVHIYTGGAGDGGELTKDTLAARVALRAATYQREGQHASRRFETDRLESLQNMSFPRVLSYAGVVLSGLVYLVCGRLPGTSILITGAGMLVRGWPGSPGLPVPVPVPR